MVDTAPVFTGAFFMTIRTTTSVYLPTILKLSMKKCIVLALLATSFNVYAQPALNKFKPAVKAAAKRMNDALVKKDIKTFVKTTYPKVVEMTDGGLTRVQSEIEKSIAGIEQAGSKILSAWPGEATTIIDTAGEYQCTIPQYMKMRLDNGVLTTQTTLIALSPDKGKTWYFIDMTDKSLAQWRTVFPNMSSKLVIFPPKEPKFEPK
jgi:hypothetical protein